MFQRDNGTSGHDTLVIVLSIVFGIVGIVLITSLGLWYRRRRMLFNRGITPIGDDEIATWKVSRAAEKEEERYTTRPSHVSRDSTGSAKIQYQKRSRPSTDAVVTPRSFINNSLSMDLPRVPEPAAFARAPNARSGLTDETVPGDDPFVPPLRRQPSRLQKLPPNTPKTVSRATSRTRGSRSNSTKSHYENWQSSSTESSPTGSDDANQRSGHSRVYSSAAVPPRLSSSGDNEAYTGLSPPPSRRQYDAVGQAIG